MSPLCYLSCLLVWWEVDRTHVITCRILEEANDCTTITQSTSCSHILLPGNLSISFNQARCSFVCNFEMLRCSFPLLIDTAPATCTFMKICSSKLPGYVPSLEIWTQPVATFLQSVDKQSTLGQWFSPFLTQRWNYFILYTKNKNNLPKFERNLAACSSKFKLKLVSFSSKMIISIGMEHCDETSLRCMQKNILFDLNSVTNDFLSWIG